MRARNIKPSFFKNAELGECSLGARLLFVGLWGLSDREGRLLDRPKQIKAEVFPYDDFSSAQIEAMLEELSKWGLIKRYEVEGVRVIWVVTFKTHQRPHVKEKNSELPAFEAKHLPRHDPAPAQVSASTNLGDVEPALNPESGILNPECGMLKEEVLRSAPRQQEDGYLQFSPSTGQLGMWEHAYPKLNVQQEVLQALAKFNTTGRGREGPNAFLKFVNGWLQTRSNSKQQETEPVPAAPGARW